MFSYQVYRTLKIVQKVGAPMTYRRVTSTFNPVTQVTSAAANNDFPITGLVMSDDSDLRNNSDTAATALSIVIDAAALSISPIAGDQIILNNIAYRIIEVIPGYIGAQIVSYDLRSVV